MKKLNKKNIEDIFALTPMQEGMLFHYLKDTESDHHFEQLNLEIGGEIDIEIFEKAWNFVVKTNQMLRAVFCWEEVANPVQIILKNRQIQPQYYDFSDKDCKEAKKKPEEIKVKDREKKFDLREVPFRVTLCKVQKAEHEMIISNHHILYDGWSNGIILKEFFAAYNDLANRKGLVKPDKTKFKEFVKWIQDQGKDGQEKFWKDYLKGFDTQTGISIKRIKKGKEQEGPGKQQIGFEKDERDKIENFAKKNKITLASFIYSAWGLLLQKYNNTNDVLFGTTISGRGAKVKSIEDIIGLFINTIPLRVQTFSNEKILNLLHRIDHALRMREEYEHTPLVNIRKYSEIDNKEELFYSILIIENYPLDSVLMLEKSQLSINSYSIFEMTHYDLAVSVKVFAGIDFTFSYDKEAFAEDSIVRLINHFKCIMESILRNPDVKAVDFEIITTEEKNKILYEFNNTGCHYPKNKTIHQLFEEQVEKTPDRIATVGPLLQISYRELNNKSNRIAYLLGQKGVKPDTTVGIMVERSIGMVIGILGILKSGGAYLPIEPEYPAARINYMLSDSQAKILLTTKNIAKAINFDKEMIYLNSSSPQASLNLSEGRLFNSHHSKSLAYVIYTSGSTGKPKGVMVEHISAVNLLFALQDQYPFGQSDTYLLKTSYVFDVSVTELFGWYLDGGKAAVLKKGGEKDPRIILDSIEKNRVSHINFVPSMFHVFIEHVSVENKNRLSGLKYIFLAGEVLPPGLVEKSRNLGTTIRLENIYGPTEGTVYASKYSLSQWSGSGSGSIPIGKPLQNVKLYVLGKNNHLQPIGVPGELCISGAGVARGYLNRPGLTFERFTNYKQITNKEVPGERIHMSHMTYMSYIYLTGDLACWLADGNIEYLGRIDQQVKVRGFRIEPGEIENCLRKYPGVKEALVISGGPDNELCAYIVTVHPITTSRLRKHLSRHLPFYMVPSFFVRLDAVPLTPTGKVDRKSLPQPKGERPEPDSLYMGPTNEVEKIISHIWEELLGIKNIGINDHFFDLGGNSLTLIRLNSQLNRQFKKNISMIRMFRHPTIRSLARHIKGKEEETRLKRMSGQFSPGEVAGTGPKGKKGLDIAVIGMAGRFPGADHIDRFRENLINGKESITFFADHQPEVPGIDAPELAHSHYVKAKGRLDNNHCFDSTFFGYSSREVEQMDPQVRIFHQCVWEALEDAGYDPGAYNGLIGLYAGASSNPLWEAALLTDSTGRTFSTQWESLQYRDKDFLGTRVAHRLNLKGPAVSMHTACSTSLVAIDTACRGLLSGQCHMALAGGVSVTLHDEAGYLYQEGMVLSTDGHCRAFDASANGTVSGNGAGVVVLKPLSRAVADGDNIYAVIKGSAVNNDGLDKVGYTAPAIEGQAAVIRTALQSAGVEPESIGYLEAHGTGTPLGDPTEIEGLTLAFDTPKQNYCAIGSVKTNIGHLDTAAGVAGFIKTVLVLKHKKIPPSLHFETPNPKIDFDNSPFYVNTEPWEWKANDYPRRAGVSSFGIGGTNVHVVLEESPVIGHSSLVIGERKERENQLILLSARTESALERAAQNLADHFKKNPGLNLADAAYTLQVGRRVFNHRRMAVCSDVKEAIDLSSDPHSGGCHNGVPDEEKPDVIFLFPGQGSQYVDMGLGLYQTEPIFREEIDRCFEILKPLIGYDIKDILYPLYRSNRSNRSYKSYKSHIHQTEIAQPVIFSIEYALAKLLMKWGIKARAMMGHSIGEYTAACLSGIFSLEDALKLVALRGRLMQQMPTGSMLSVSLAEEALIPLLEGNRQLLLAAVNSTSLCTVSGPHEAVAAFEKKLAGMGYSSQKLHTSHAFHSSMMDPILAPFKEAVAKVTAHTLKIPFISNVTGDWITAEQAGDPGYWARHLRCTVRFGDGIEKLVKKKNALFMEVGPGRVLSTLVRKHADRQPQQQVIETIRHPGDRGSDIRYLLTAVGGLWLRGTHVQWPVFHENQKRQRISLPTYSFEPLPYPFKIALQQARIPGVVTAADHRQVKTTGEPGKKRGISDWFYVPTWQQEELPDISDPQPRPKDSWLVFIDRWGTSLVKQLLRQNPAVVTVIPGPAFEPPGDIPRQYTLNPRNPADYNALLQELEKTVGIPGKILHLWNVREGHQCPGNPEEVANIQDLGFYSLIHLVRAIGKECLNHTFDILVVSSNMQEVTGGDLHRPYSATLSGAAAIIPQEYPNITVRSIDMSIQEENAAGDEIPGHIHREFIAGSPGQFIALRSGKRYVQAFEPVQLGASADTLSRLREEGVYLVTGGLGGIGLVLAGYLAKKNRARLVLTCRSPFPPREEWEEWLATHPGDDPISKKVRKLQTFETMGARVLVLTADVTDKRQMRQVKVQTLERFGAVHGIIHCAGVPGGGVIQGQSIEHFEKVLAPKVKGTWVLDTLFKNEPLDFFVSCSSINAVVPVFGQSAYTAANTFLDAYARCNTYHNSKGTFNVSINWDTWQEVGMAAKAAAGTQSRRLSHPLLHWSGVTGNNEIRYTSNFSVKKLWVLDEHRIMDKAVLPGTAYLEMARSAIEQQVGPVPIEIRDLYFLAPLVVEDDEEREIHTIVKKKDDPGTFEFSIFSMENSSPGREPFQQQHAAGKAVAIQEPQPGPCDITELETLCPEVAEVAPDIEQTGSGSRASMTFGPRWSNVKRVSYGEGRGLVRLELDPAFTHDILSYGLHPALLDTAAAFLQLHIKEENPYLPAGYKKVRILRPLPASFIAFANRIDSSRDSRRPGTAEQGLEFNITIMTEKGEPLVEIEGFTMKQVGVFAAPNYQLHIAAPGNLETLFFQPAPRQRPGPGEVEIQVQATGLNFKEVLIALGMVPAPGDTDAGFGLECSGRVIACGEGVTDFKTGDAVIAYGTSFFSRRNTVPVSNVALMPRHLNFEEAATIPVAFMTAYHSLVQLARLGKDERVLIHSAAGGVGLAAVKIAQWKEAEIFATAGTPQKQEYLRSIGVRHVMDSHSLSFAHEVMTITNGRGVDVLLNSLAGEFIPKGLSVMAPYGRFLEIGIRDILNNMELGLRPFEKCLSFFSINLSEKLPGFTSLLRQVVRHFDNKDLTPLPFRVFPIEETARAFKTMARAKHTGKIVVSQRRLRTTAAAGEPGAKENLNPGTGLLPHEGVEVFSRILGAPPLLPTTGKPLSQIVVSTGDLTLRLKRNQPGGDLPTADALEISPPPAVVQSRPRLNTPYSPPVNQSHQILTRIWQDYLGIEKIGIHDNFFELGATSLDLIQISTRLKETLNQDIPVVTLFTYSTIHSLTEYLKLEEDSPGDSTVNEDVLQAAKKGRNRLKNQKKKRN